MSELRMKQQNKDEQLKQMVLDYIPLNFTSRFQEIGAKAFERITFDGELYRVILEEYLPYFSHRETIKNLMLPILSIAGTADRVVDIEYIRKGISFNKLIEAHEIQNVGHYPFIENSKEFNNIIINFIKERKVYERKN